jgi:hypothetical protein
MAAMVQVPFGNTTVSRIAPAMPVQAYKTYGMSMPFKTHWRSATCDEVDCEAWRKGWVSTFDLGTELGRRQHDYCKADRGRSFSMQRATLTLVKFVYPPGNRCFRSDTHRLPLGRPARLFVAGGDWRGFTSAPRAHVRAQDWVEDFAGHQDRLSAAIEKG